MTTRYTKDQLANLPKLTNRQQEIINGSMLGDGSIKIGSKNSYFRKTQCAANLEYLQWMYEELYPYSKSICKRESKGIIHDKYRRIIGYDDRIFLANELTSIYHPIFTNLEEKWYLRNSQKEYVRNHNGRRIKCVASDIQLTPLTLAIWHMDDGCNNRANNTIRIATNSFTHEEVNVLTEKLKNTFDLRCNIYRDATGPIIDIHARSYLDFINIVSPYITFNCFNYKIDATTYKELQPYKHHEIKGVYFHEQTGKWRSEITIKNKHKHLGCFVTKEEAINARKCAEQTRIANGDTPRQFLSYLEAAT